MSRCTCNTEDGARIYMAGRLWNPDCPIHGEGSGPGDRLSEVLDKQLRDALGPPMTDKPTEPPSVISFTMSDAPHEELTSEKWPDGSRRDEADKPWDDDPPATTLSMLEVLEEAQEHSKVMRERAQDMQAHSALKAILEGHPVEVVAEACGFKITAPSATSRNWMQTPFGMVEMTPLGPRMIDPDDVDDHELREFIAWCGEYFARLCKGKSRA
jgi:hypothetical protein